MCAGSSFIPDPDTTVLSIKLKTRSSAVSQGLRGFGEASVENES